jgi:hypothetical protein
MAAVYHPPNSACRFAGTSEADDGTRTHDLLHGKSWRAFAPVRARSLKARVSSGFFEPSERDRTRANGECSLAAIVIVATFNSSGPSAPTRPSDRR